MQKVGTDERGRYVEPDVDRVLERIKSAFQKETGRDWMDALDVRPETVRTWRKRGFVPAVKLMKVAELTGRPVEWLAPKRYDSEPSAAAPSSADPAQEVREGRKSWPSGSAPPETKVLLDVQQYLLVPQMNVQTSAGNGFAVDTEDVIGRFAFRRDWLSRKVASTDALRVITAKGRSMEPTVRDGDILLVDTSPQERLTDGIYVLNVEGESRCKRLQRLVDGGLRIHSDNAAEFPPEDVPLARVDLVRVVGRVIWVGGER